MPLYLNNVNTVILPGLKDANGNFINNATVSFVLTDPNNVTVASGSMPYVAASNGKYEGSIAASTNLVVNTVYTTTITGTLSSVQIFQEVRTDVAQIYTVAPCPTPATTPSITSSDYSQKVAAIDAALDRIMQTGQEVFLGTTRISFADIGKLLALRKEFIKALAFQNGQYGPAIGEVNATDDFNDISMGL